MKNWLSLFVLNFECFREFPIENKTITFFPSSKRQEEGTREADGPDQDGQRRRHHNRSERSVDRSHPPVPIWKNLTECFSAWRSSARAACQKCWRSSSASSLGRRTSTPAEMVRFTSEAYIYLVNLSISSYFRGRGEKDAVGQIR